MAECSAKCFIAVGVHAVLVFLAEKIQETVNIPLMYKGVIIPRPEKLLEVECLFILCIVSHEVAEVIGVDVD